MANTSIIQIQTPAFNANDGLYTELEQLAKETKSQDIITLTNIALHIFRYTDAVITFSTVSKKPSMRIINQIRKHIDDEHLKIYNDFIDKHRSEHASKAVCISIKCCHWIEHDLNPKYPLEEAIRMSTAEIKQLRTSTETNWGYKLIAVSESYKEHISQYSNGLAWKGTADGDFTAICEGKVPDFEESSVFSLNDDLYRNLVLKARETQNQDIVALVHNFSIIAKIFQTDIVLHAFRYTDAVITISAVSEKPSIQIINQMTKYLDEKYHSIYTDFLDKKSSEQAAKAAWIAVKGCHWIEHELNPKYPLEEASRLSSAEVKQLKEPLEIEWGNIIVEIINSYKAYTAQHCPNGIVWRGKQEGDFSSIVSAVSTAVSSKIIDDEDDDDTQGEESLASTRPGVIKTKIAKKNASGNKEITNDVKEADACRCNIF